MKPNTKAILLNASHNTIEFITINSAEDIRKFGNFQLFDCVQIDENGNTAFVDDEGLLNGTNAGFLFLGKIGLHNMPEPLPLMGNIIILGTNDEGDSVDTTMTCEEAQDLFQQFCLVGRMMMPSDEEAFIKI